MMGAHMRGAVVLVVLLLGCLGGAPASSNCQWAEFRKLSFNERQEAMKHCSPGERVELYLKSASATIPPNSDLADTLASMGGEVVPAIVARIERSEKLVDELEKPELLFVLERMQVLGSFDVAKDPALMNRLSAAVSSMNERELREWAQDTLSIIAKRGS